jgi:hypothetical protein
MASVSVEPTWFEKLQTYISGSSPDPRAANRRAHGGLGPEPLTAAEVMAHPEFPHVHWELKADQKASVEVGRGRGGPFKIAYEIHGHGPSKIIV